MCDSQQTKQVVAVVQLKSCWLAAALLLAVCLWTGLSPPPARVAHRGVEGGILVPVEDQLLLLSCFAPPFSTGIPELWLAPLCVDGIPSPLLLGAVVVSLSCVRQRSTRGSSSTQPRSPRGDAAVGCAWWWWRWRAECLSIERFQG